MLRAGRTRWTATLLLAILAWGGLGVGVVDAVMFHRLTQAAGRGELPAVGGAERSGGHAAVCVLAHPLPAARMAPPPSAGAIAVGETLLAVLSRRDLAPHQVLDLSTLRSRAPPSSLA